MANTPYYTKAESDAKFSEVVNNNRWQGKNYLAIGDSVTSALKYQNTVASELGLNVTTHAQGGIGLTAMVDGASSLDPLDSSIISDKDIITVFGGLNDRHSSIGQRGDLHPTQSTIYGKLQYVINKIYELAEVVNRKDVKIVLVTPHKVGKYAWIDADGDDEYPSGSGQTLEDIANAIKDLGGLYGLPVVDLFHNSGINDFTWDIYTTGEVTTSTVPPYPENPDNLHPNDAGHDLIARAIISEINKI